MSVELNKVEFSGREIYKPSRMMRERENGKIIPFSVIQVEDSMNIIMNVTECNLGRLMHMQKRMEVEEKKKRI